METTTRPCDQCRIPTLPYTTWTKAPQPVRDTWKATGLRRAGARGLCNTCYRTRWATGQLTDHPRRNVPRRDVLEDWAALSDERAGLSQTQAVRIMAPRLGMTPAALEKALARARARGEDVAA